MEIKGITNIGKSRAINQDSYYIGDDWCVIADGMGGHNGGEIASAMAIDSIKNHLMHYKNDFYGAISHANQDILNCARSDESLTGMGTTVVLAHMENNIASFYNVGDSRGYKINAEEIVQLTKDHSVVAELVETGTITWEEAESHPKKNLITRAVGTYNNVEVDRVQTAINPGDTLLLCSDGLNSMLSSQVIYDVVSTNNLENSLALLVELANDAGGTDNITIILIKE